MANLQPPATPQDHFDNLMQAGQAAIKQFDSALASVIGGPGGDAKPDAATAFSPVGLMVDMQRDYFRQVWKFWNATFLQAIPGASQLETAAKGDRRFKDKAWEDQPYYDLLKQVYLLSSRQLQDFVERAQVDDRTKLKLRFFARQYIDAISPSNFPATNPEVIRTAIETRSASLATASRTIWFERDVIRGAGSSTPGGRGCRR